VNGEHARVWKEAVVAYYKDEQSGGAGVARRDIRQCSGALRPRRVPAGHHLDLPQLSHRLGRHAN
jgi:hypothetical protein